MQRAGRVAPIRTIDKELLMRVLLFLPLLMMACTAVPPAPTEQSGTMTPQHGGTFLMTALSSPTHLHRFTDPTIATSATVTPIYDTLLRFDYSGDFRDDLTILPALVERWERVDNTTYLFHVRKNVKFHDG